MQPLGERRQLALVEGVGRQGEAGGKAQAVGHDRLQQPVETVERERHRLHQAGLEVPPAGEGKAGDGGQCGGEALHARAAASGEQPAEAGTGEHFKGRGPGGEPQRAAGVARQCGECGLDQAQDRGGLAVERALQRIEQRRGARTAAEHGIKPGGALIGALGQFLVQPGHAFPGLGVPARPQAIFHRCSRHRADGAGRCAADIA